MFRYYTNNKWSLATLSTVVIVMLITQIVTPTIVFAIAESEVSTVEQIIPTEPNTQSTELVVDEEEAEEAAIELDDTASEETPSYSSSTSTETTIETGDAVAGLDIKNESNVNETSTLAEEPVNATTTIATTTASTTDESNDEIEIIPDDTSLLNVSSSNTATTTNSATTTAITGQNSASGNITTINTGDAVAYTDVLNVVNTNIVNSAGLVKFVNQTLGYKNFDLRDDFTLTYAEFDTSQTTKQCSLDSCGGEVEKTINSNNTATIENNVKVVANTGSNQASGNSSEINTGNAYASANIINVANTNITDSNYLLMVFNNFNDFAGDIVLPNSAFFDNIFRASSGVNPTSINLTNTATVNNNVSSVAETGNNSASGNNSEINTGNSFANGSVNNQINQNIIGGSSFSMLIRVHGNWSGTINGLPDGLTWRETERGIEIVSIGNTGTLSSNTNLTQSSNNSAVINNNVQVYALTGDNEAAGNKAKISTGNAHADSSILNIANTNVIGSNWSNLIFTIYGNWSGNLSFGQPNLWLGVAADSPDSPIMPGSKVTYTYTIFNSGDTTAPNVTLSSVFENAALTFDSSTNRTIHGTNAKTSWELGSIGAGETREITYTATVGLELDRNVVSAIPLNSRVTASVEDADDSDNEDVVTIYVGERRTKSKSTSPTFLANFDIEKTASRDLAQPGDTVDYTVTFLNHGGQLYDAVLVDVMEDESGKVIQQQTWPFEEIKNGEKITVNYSVEFDSAIATGTYTNYAQLVGFHGSKKEKYQTPYESSVANHKLGLGTMPAGEVLGISTTNCPPYITEYLRYGSTNNPNEVLKLQQFLNTELNRNLSQSGYFDLETEQAVRDFQIIHEDEILTPWGLKKDSGYVYYTTQKKINEIVCGGKVAFPLASHQLKEIDSFRSRLNNYSKIAFKNPTEPEPAKPEVITAALAPAPTVRKIESVTNTDKPNPTNSVDEQAPKRTRLWNGIKTWFQSLPITRKLHQD